MRILYRGVQDENGKWQFIEAALIGAPEPRIHIIDDSMSALEHPCTGEMIDSKRQFDAITKAHGCVSIGHRPGDQRAKLFEADQKRQSKVLLENLERAWQEKIEPYR